MDLWDALPTSSSFLGGPEMSQNSLSSLKLKTAFFVFFSPEGEGLLAMPRRERTWEAAEGVVVVVVVVVEVFAR